ncbi:Zn-dependent alcohol dehydrogenase [Streptomyces sp. GD-15H]|uniref:Zn-dependent alcohol dehydrogenase n=1 Tax=Streptomyces sp. GD-15H TaxID=3129112 RepID=UPI00324E7BDE
MKTKAAVVFEPGRPWEVVELELDPPKAGEVQVRFVAAGLCHSDEYMRLGELRPRYPLVGGHEGAGVIEAVGEGVTGLSVGDPVVCSFRPACGRCRFCAMGKSNLCDEGARLFEGSLPDGTFRFHHGDLDVGANAMLGTFSERAVVPAFSCIKVAEDLPLTSMAMLGCAVPTGWGAAVHSGDVRPGEVVVVLGSGGVGINAVQGARMAGAAETVVVDPVQDKLEIAKKLGATRTATTADEAKEIVQELTGGHGADKAIVTAGVPGLAESGFSMLRKGGTLVLAGMGNADTLRLDLPVSLIARADMRIVGSAMGSCNFQIDIPRLISLYRSGDLRLDELVSGTYALDDISLGYEDMYSGKNLRGVILFD